MAVSFSDQEKQVIIFKLKEAAAACAAVVGIRKTTVDQLVEAAEISKGMFYKLYPSKEMLFLEMLEDMHRDAYKAADKVLKQFIQLNEAERTAKALMEACQVMEKSGMVGILEKDMTYLLRRIPKDIIEKNYHSDEVHINELFDANGLKPSCGEKVAADTVRALFLTISHRTEIGSDYNTVLQIIIEGTCSRMFSE